VGAVSSVKLYFFIARQRFFGLSCVNKLRFVVALFALQRNNWAE
jgi:hypothetical protein